MADKKAESEPKEPKVEFSDSKMSETKAEKSSRKKKVTVIGSLTVLLLLGVVVSVAVYFSLKESTPRTRLTEINLKEGDTLTYQVDQNIEVNAGNASQKGMSFDFYNKNPRGFVILTEFCCSSTIFAGPNEKIKQTRCLCFWHYSDIIEYRCLLIK